MFSKDFKEILDNYKKDFQESESLIKDKISDSFAGSVNENFTIRTCSPQKSLPENPWISLTDKSFDSLQEALVIEYSFNIEKSSVTLSLIPRLEDYTDYIEASKLLKAHLKNLDLKDFKFTNQSYSLIHKTYAYGDLDDDTLTADLDFLCEIYYEVIYEFRYFSQEEMADACFNESLEYSKGVFYNKSCKEELIPKVKDIDVDYPKMKNYKNDINDPEDLLRDENIDRIIKTNLKIDDYRNILTDIKQNSQLKMIDIIKQYGFNLKNLQTKDKVLLYSKSYTDTEFKSIGRPLGYYRFNTIKIDDRLSNPLIITSIIHELSHFILEKILKEVLMKILNTNDTPLISSYIKITLEDNDLNYLLDEFCAHTVEGRFALYGFQDYSSFKYKLDEISGLYSKEDIDYALVVANTFAYDIKDIFEEYIDDDLRQEIKDEFSHISYPPKYEPLDFEIESRLDDDDFMDALSIILTSGIGELLNNPEKLQRYMVQFKD